MVSRLQNGEACPKFGQIVLLWRGKAGEAIMWYVIQTFGGEEERTADMIEKGISADLIKECFIPKREKLKKFHGCWHKVEEILFPGYVFAVTERPWELYQELKRIPRLTRFLGKEGQFFFSLNQEEEKLVRELGNQEHKTEISMIEVREGKKIRVIDGPLKDYVGDVVRVNLHKREVAVRVEFMGREMELRMGIEMVGRGE